jgi:fatty acid desaturase
MAGLTHFHLPMSEGLDRSYLRGVVERTQNIGDAGWLWAWMAGGLEHHIEHHLFAAMPRRNYARIAPRVRALCVTHGLPYRSCTKVEAVWNLYSKLAAPVGRESYARRSFRRVATAVADRTASS